MQGSFTGIKADISYNGVLSSYHSETDKRLLRRFQIGIASIALAIMAMPLLWYFRPISGWMLIPMVVLLTALGIVVYIESIKRSLADYEVIKSRYSQYLPQGGLSEKGRKFREKVREIFTEIRVDNFDQYCQNIGYDYIISLNDISNRIRNKTILWNRLRHYRFVAIFVSTSIVMLLSCIVDYYLNTGTFEDSFIAHLKDLAFIALLLCSFAYCIDMFKMGLQEKKERPYKDLQNVINAKIDWLIGKQK